MATVKEADLCIKYLDRSVLEGRVITVEKLLLTAAGQMSVAALRQIQKIYNLTAKHATSTKGLYALHYIVSILIMSFRFPICCITL